MSDQAIEIIAKACHEANRGYCQAIGDNSQKSWEDSPEWQRSSAMNGVRFHLENPDAGPSHSHECWLEEKRATGWKFGHVKDEALKEHPCFVPYDELPTEQKAKGYIFRSIVHSLAHLAHPCCGKCRAEADYPSDDNSSD